MSTSPVLSTHAKIYARLKEILQTEYDLGEEDPALLDTLTGETSLQEHLAIAVRRVQDDESAIDGLQKRINQMQERKSRLIKRMEGFREAIAWAMREAGMKRFTEPEVTVSMRMSKPPLLFLKSPDDEWVPTAFTTKMTTTSYSWNRTALREAVEMGNPRAIEVATLGEPEPILVINTK